MNSGRVEASQDSKKNGDGRRRIDSNDLRGEDSPYWSLLEMDMGRRLDLESGSIVT